MRLTNDLMTMAPASAGDTSRVAPEFGRIRDVENLFGLKRGTTYNLLNAGKIRGCVLRVKGQRSGVRLIDLASVREYIIAQMSNPDGIQQMKETSSK